MNKTYCISDLHAHYDKLQSFLKDIDETDTVYFLGDAEDKGPDALKCLLHIMNDKRFKFILGNHDYMMYSYIKASMKNKSKDPSLDQIEKYRLWVDYNKGGSTLDEFEKLPIDLQNKIMEYFENAKLFYPDIVVNKRHFVLVHSFPWVMFFENSNVSVDTPLTMKDLKYDDSIINLFIWERPQDNFANISPVKGKTVIVGHTMTPYFFSDPSKSNSSFVEIYHNRKTLKKSDFIAIDCALAANIEQSRLCALCLDDMSVKYY